MNARERPDAFDDSPWRTLAAAIFAGAAVAALVALALYLSGVLFLLMNRVDPGRAHVTSIVHYWQVYSVYPSQRRKLKMSMGVAGAGLGVLLAAAFMGSARPRRPLYGDARFATKAEVRRANLLGEDKARIIVGKYDGDYLGLPGQQSVLICASTRSGKGAGVVVPNLLNWTDSVVVLDIKGENYKRTAGWRARRGHTVYAFSPFDDGAVSHRWNPLSSVRPATRHRVGDLLRLGQVFYPNDGSGSSSEAFFNDQARNLFMGLGLLLLETPELPLTIGEMLRQSSGKGMPLHRHIGRLFRARQAKGQPYTSECREALQRTLSNSPNTLSSIVSSFTAPLIIFADAIVDAATSASDFRLEDVRRRHMSVYLRIPPNRLADARPLLALFFSQLVDLNTSKLPEDDPSLRLQCLLVNDEFAALGRVQALANSAAFLAGYNLRLLTVVQAMSQIEAVYGEKHARTFATNHALQILFAPREQHDANEYSAMLGDLTERATSSSRSTSNGLHGYSSSSHTDSDQRRPLLLPQEVKEIGGHQLVVMLENCKPILGRKIRYYLDGFFLKRTRTAPPVPEIDVEAHHAEVQDQWERFKAALPSGSDRHASPFDDDAVHAAPTASPLAQDTLIDMCGDDGLLRMSPATPSRVDGPPARPADDSPQRDRD